MIVFPNARVSLGLQVIAKRSDGYHNIRSIMLPVSLYDALEVRISDDCRTHFFQSGQSIPGYEEKNLCLKAYDILQKYLYKSSPETKIKQLPPLKIHLLKGIPACSGLAGGSANAAFMLKLLTKMFDLNINEEVLTSLAAELGSDCPFFIHNKAMHASGRGEILQPMPYLSKLKDLQIIISIPPQGVKTKEAFKWIIPQKTKLKLPEVYAKEVEDWQHLLVNDFEKFVFRKYPNIGSIKEKMLDAGALYASLSGSGSAVFGLFKNLNSLETLQNAFPSNKTLAVRPLM